MQEGCSRATGRWHGPVQGCALPLCRLPPSGLGLAQLCPLQRDEGGALRWLFPVMSEGKPSWSPSPGWQHEGRARALGNIWQWAVVFAIAAERWYHWGLCQHIIFHSSFDLRAGRFWGRFITKQQSLVLQTHSCSCFRQSWNGIFFSKVTLKEKQQVLSWQPGTCWWASSASFPGPLPCVQAITSSQGLTHCGAEEPRAVVINLLTPTLCKTLPPLSPLWMLMCVAWCTFQPWLTTD